MLGLSLFSNKLNQDHASLVRGIEQEGKLRQFRKFGTPCENQIEFGQFRYSLYAQVNCFPKVAFVSSNYKPISSLRTKSLRMTGPTS
uniref:Far upstream element-binding protein 1 isoform X2 n=1 Tax=Rhizophora mucronata TaxID=61149 RepID=A0A2P2IUU5_RHIMU